MTALVVIAAIGDDGLAAAISERLRGIPIEYVVIDEHPPWKPGSKTLVSFRAIERGQPSPNTVVICLGHRWPFRWTFSEWLVHLADRLPSTAALFGEIPLHSVRALLVVPSQPVYDWCALHIRESWPSGWQEVIGPILCRRDDPKSMDDLLAAIVGDRRHLAPPTEPNLEEGVGEMPDSLRLQIEELEAWAKANRADSIRDTIAFWTLKLPAVITSAASGLLAHFELTAMSVCAGAIASFCVIVDGIHPRGMLRNVHVRAFHDIRLLTTRMMSDWRSRNPTAKAENTARRIIKGAESDRERIAKYIRDAESALKSDDNA